MRMPEMAVTSQLHPGSAIHDGFATIRAPRSRIKIRSLVVGAPPAPSLPQHRHSEYFTLSPAATSFLDGCKVYAPDAADAKCQEKRLSFTEPIYARVSPPQSQRSSPVKSRPESQYDRIDTKPPRRLRAEAGGEARRRSHSDNCSESSGLTDERPVSSYSDTSTLPSTDTEDVLRELPRAPRAYATLSLRRPRHLPTRPAVLSEPGTPLDDDPPILSEAQQVPRMALQSHRNGFRRSVSETAGLSKRLNYRHSISTPSARRPHQCCECVTGAPAPEPRALGTLYEAQDPRVGCQSILRAKPPVPWWELAIRKSRYNSCPILDEAHVVSAFEQSLSNMTQRLHQLTATAERKDSELTELRQTIELLRKQSIQAGLTTAHMHSMGIPAELAHQEGGAGAGAGGARAGGAAGGSMSRHLSTDSVASATSLSSGSSNLDKKLKKKGWLRSSFTKAFSRNAKISKTAKHASLGALGAEGAGGAAHLYDDPATIREGEHEDSLEPEPHTPAPADAALDGREKEESHLVDELKRQLREKELVLTDIRLEALSSAHQLESLKDTVTKMRSEMMNLKQNNERLQRLVTSRSLAGSQSSLAPGDARRYSLAEPASEPLYGPAAELAEPLYGNAAAGAALYPSPAVDELYAAPAVDGLFADTSREHAALPPPTARELAIGETYHDLGAGEAGAEGEAEGKRVAIAVFLGPPEAFPRFLEEVQDTLTEAECGLPAPEPAAGAADLPVAYTRVSGKTSWQALDYTVRKALKEYLARVDPGAGLGLSTDCVLSYHLGEATRGPERALPPLLPCGYIVGTVSTLYVCLDAVGSLAFDSLIPRSIVHRYVSLVSEHRRVILCGPSGTGKSYLAAKLAEYHVQRTTRRGNPAGAVATFNVERKSSSELRAFLANIAEQCAAAAAGEEAPLPSVLVLDNLAHAAALGDVFAGLPAALGARMPLIIGTMSQATCDTTNLQLQHDFRWLLTANHLEPVKGFLARYLRRKLLARELAGRREPALRAVVEWLPAVWAALNAFLEAVAASDVTVGPRLFLACPMDARASQAWFADVWNYSVVPYAAEAAREGARLYGRRAARDPTQHVRATWPWPARTHDAALRPILPEGAPEPAPEPATQDPLLGMLLRLQEAADYGAGDQDSDDASLDSNLTHDSSLGAEP